MSERSGWRVGWPTSAVAVAAAAGLMVVRHRAATVVAEYDPTDSGEVGGGSSGTGRTNAAAAGTGPLDPPTAAETPEDGDKPEVISGHEVARRRDVEIQIDVWIKNFHEANGNANWAKTKRHRLAAIQSSTCVLGWWPVGNNAGELLAAPVVDNTDVHDRGVAGEWLEKFRERMMNEGGHRVPTRVLVESFVKPLTRDFGCCALYYFIPPAFRKRPSAFVSHAWDGLIAHFLTEEVTREDSLWLDFIAIKQHPGNVPEVKQIGAIVANIGNTLLCMPGCGDNYEAMRPVARSWCIFEIVNTPDGCLKVVVGTDNLKEARHAQNGASIRQIDVESAQARDDPDKIAIDTLVRKKYGDFNTVNRFLRRLIMAAFFRHYKFMDPSRTGNDGKRLCDFAEYYLPIQRPLPRVVTLISAGLICMLACFQNDMIRLAKQA